MNDDLISREALKEVFNGYHSGIGSQPKFTLGACLQLIDNAPSVEPFEPDYVGAERLEARQRGYEDGYHNGMEIGKTLNPKIKQGEWIPKQLWDNTHVWVCSECGNQNTHGITEEKACWKCGAKMIGSEKMNGGEEERMNTEDDIKQCRTEGIPNEALILNRLQNAEILDDYATKLAQGDDVASGRMSVAEYEAVISALSYAVSYMRGAL